MRGRRSRRTADSWSDARDIDMAAERYLKADRSLELSFPRRTFPVRERRTPSQDQQGCQGCQGGTLRVASRGAVMWQRWRARRSRTSSKRRARGLLSAIDGCDNRAEAGPLGSNRSAVPPSLSFCFILLSTLPRNARLIACAVSASLVSSADSVATLFHWRLPYTL